MATFQQIIDQEGLPASVHTERVILGAMMSDSVAVSEATARLVEDDFSLDAHRRIYSAMLELVESSHTIDLTTLAAVLERRKELEAIGQRSYLASLYENLPRHLAIEHYVGIVREKSVKRQILKVCEVAMSKAVDPGERGDAVLGDLESRILDISSGADEREFGVFAEEVEAHQGIDAYVEAVVDPNRAMGLRSGLADVDAMTSGLRAAELSVIAARPSMGKTALAMNVVAHVADETDERGQRVVAVFSLEMEKSALFRRMLAADSEIEIGKVTRQEVVSQDERRRLRTASMRQAERRVFVDDTSTMSVLKLRAKARRLKQREGRLDLIVIDYLQLLVGDRKKYSNRQEEVADISRGLKALAKDLQVPVVALSQLSRATETHTDKRPTLASLRESGQIEQDADVVAFIHREEYYDRDNEDVRGLAEFIIAKQRDGPTGVVKLAYHASFTKFSNLAYY